METTNIIEDKEITEDRYYDMLGAVPPLWISSLDGKPMKAAFALGEAYSHAKIGDGYKATFLAFYEKDGKYYEVGNKVFFTGKGIAFRVDESDLVKYSGGGEVKDILPSDLKTGLHIIQKSHPEYGTFVVQRKYDNGIWEIRGKSGDTTLFETELKFWRKAYPNEYAIGGGVPVVTLLPLNVFKKGGLIESVKSFLNKKVTLQDFTK